MNQVETTKKCSKCQEVKSISEFYASKYTKDLHAYICKVCDKIKGNNRYIDNKLHIDKINKIYRDAHKDKIKEINVIYRINNKEKERLRHAKYNKLNSVKRIKWLTEYRKERKAVDPAYKLLLNSRTRINHILKNYNKCYHTIELIGCSAAEYRQHLENLFKDGMSWDNYGADVNNWSVDHRIPLSFFNMDDPIEQLQAFYYKNCQPLWNKENKSKNDTINYEYAYYLS